jgi:membrane protein
MDMKQILKQIERLWDLWKEDHISTLAGALAYYGLFSLVPSLIIILVLFNILFVNGALDGKVVSQAQSFAADQTPSSVEEVFEKAFAQASTFEFTLFNFALLLFGAAGLLTQVKSSLSIIWKVKDKENATLKETIRSYLLPFVMIPTVGFLLLLSSLLTIILVPAGEYLDSILHGTIGFLRLLTFFISFSFVTMIFTATYKTMTETRLTWAEALNGALISAALFIIGNLALEQYVRISNVASAYGAASYLVIFLLWIYYSAYVFLFGAEIIKLRRMRAHK